MTESRRPIMVPVEGYWKVQLICLTLLILIAVAIMGFRVNDDHREVNEESNTIVTYTECSS